MLDQKNQSYAERFESAFNEGTVDAFDGLFSVDTVDHGPWPGHTPDLAGFKAGLTEMRASFPDLRVNVARTVAEGDLMAVHFKISGTQLGEFMGAPPSGKTFEIEAMDILRFTEGRVTEHWGVMDAAGMAAQLGF